MADRDLDERFGPFGVKVSDRELRGLDEEALRYLQQRCKLTDRQEQMAGFSPRPNGGQDPIEVVSSREPEEDDSYDSMSKAQLQAEIDLRNEQRGEDEQLPRTGAKDHLVSILIEDDATEDNTGGD